jgi:ornithine cyclodeaminase/alanine dehydrogenase
MRYLDDEAVSAHLSTADAIECVERAFRLLARGEAVNAPRRRSRSGDAVLNVMWALAPSEGVMGVKAYPVVRAGVTQGAVLTLLVYAIDTGELVAMLKADRLGQIRTGAATAVASRAMARPESETLALFGAGFQAETQLRSLALVLPGLRSVRVVSRSAGRRDAFVARMRDELGVDVRAGDAEEAVREADVIVTATGAAEPLFDGEWVKPGTHVNAVGSNASEKREVDAALLNRSAVVVTDDREVAQLDCGDLLRNGWDPAAVPTLGELLLGVTPGRRDADEITLFESQGLAIQDVVCAAHVLAGADGAGEISG